MTHGSFYFLKQSKYRFIHFEEKNTEHGIRYFCKNNKTGDHLGECAFYKKWKEWVYLPKDIVMSSQCLEDVAHFLRQLNPVCKIKR